MDTAQKEPNPVESDSDATSTPHFMPEKQGGIILKGEESGKVVCNYLILCVSGTVLLGIYMVVCYLIVKSVKSLCLVPCA